MSTFRDYSGVDFIFWYSCHFALAVLVNLKVGLKINLYRLIRFNVNFSYSQLSIFSPFIVLFFNL